MLIKRLSLRFLRESVFSPYYNKIDFEIWQDSNGAFAPLGEASSKFVALKRSTDSSAVGSDGSKWTKYAVIVNSTADYTQVKANTNARRNFKPVTFKM